MTRTLAKEVGPRGVSTLCISPGLMLGERQVQALLDPAHPIRPVLAGSMQRVSLGRPSVYDEVASVVAFFASPAGAYAHGTTISVSGGLSD